MSRETLDLSVKGMAVQSIFTDYLNGKFQVNRKYQRKLVWTRKEKEYLIDSLAKQLPMPLVLLAKGEGHSYEIVDGLQRINAIIGFLKNDFSLDGKYFDLDRLGDTKELRDQGVIEQKEPVLDAGTCRKIFNYEVPVSVYTSSDDDQVEEVFRRINSSGRHLSRQDIRQAGAEGDLPAAVRAISSQIRGDVSRGNLVPLEKMENISISESADVGRGIEIGSIFWVKNSILDEDSIRESKDEQLVLDICIDILSGNKLLATKAETRDQAYGFRLAKTDEDRYESLKLSIENYGKDQLISDFIFAFDEFNSLLEKSGKSLRNLTQLETRTKNTARYFHLMFYPFYRLLVSQKKVISDREGLLKALDGFWPNSKISVPKGGGTLSIKDKTRIFDNVDLLLSPYFSEGNPILAGKEIARRREFENNVMLTLTESSSFEVKLGLTDIDTGELNNTLLDRLPMIMSAIANKHPNGEGAIYIGLTDDDSAIQRMANAGFNSVSVGSAFKCFGLQHDYDALQKTREQYQRMIKKAFNDATKNSKKTSRELRDVKVQMFDYKGVDVCVIQMPKITQPILFKNQVFVRRGSDTPPIEMAEMYAFQEEFKKALAE